MYRFEYYYTLILIPVLYLAFFDNVNYFKKYNIKYFENIIAVLLILVSLYSARNILINIPPNMKTCQNNNEFSTALDMISQIPPEDPVSVSKTLITRVPVREHRTYLPYGIDKAAYIIVYKSEKTSTIDAQITPVITDSLKKCDSWKIIKEDNSFILFKKVKY